MNGGLSLHSLNNFIKVAELDCFHESFDFLLSLNSKNVVKY